MEEGFYSSNVLNFLYNKYNRETKWNDLKKWINENIVRSGHRRCFIMINLFVRFHSRYVSFIHSLTNNCIDQTTYTFSRKKRKPNDFFTSYVRSKNSLTQIVFIVRRFKSLSSPFHPTIDPIQSPYTKFFVTHFQLDQKSKITSSLNFLPSFLLILLRFS